MRFASWAVVLGLCFVVSGCAGQTVYMINGKSIAMGGGQTITIPKGFSGTIDGSGMDVKLNGDEVININGREIRAYSNKIEVNGKPYTVEGNQRLVISKDAITIEGAGGPKGN